MICVLLFMHGAHRCIYSRPEQIQLFDHIGSHRYFQCSNGGCAVAVVVARAYNNYGERCKQKPHTTQIEPYKYA